MPRNDDDNLDGRVGGEQHAPERDNMGLRLIYMLIIAFMLSIAQTVLSVLAIVQYILSLVNNNERNPRLADFGTDLGIWMAKAARYQAAASDVKPWPWTELD